MALSISDIYIFAHAAHGTGISGGDRIFIEFAKRWSKKVKVTVVTWKEGKEMCARQNLTSRQVKFCLINISPFEKLGFAVSYLARIIIGCVDAFGIEIKEPRKTIVYSASEFWMDSLPALVVKLRYPKVIWAASWYQTAPSPLTGFSETNRESKYRFRAFLYWFAQLPIKPLVNLWADKVLVNNEEEKKKFSIHNRNNNAIVVIGAVNVEEIKKWQSEHKQSASKIYDAVFQGRFHPQKGVVELVDIWAKVVRKIPNAKLAMIGDGPLITDVKSRITKYKLQKYVSLLGYVFDGDEKYKIFSQSKLVVHPSFYDSGGMASAEAMSFGLPVIGFDLPSYESYYPQGMVKVEGGNLDKFARAIITLLKDNQKRRKLGKEAQEMVYKNWSWEKRAWEVMRQIVI